MSDKYAQFEAAKKTFAVIEAQSKATRRFEIFSDHGQETEHFICNGLTKDDAETIVYLLRNNHEVEMDALCTELDLR